MNLIKNFIPLILFATIVVGCKKDSTTTSTSNTLDVKYEIVATANMLSTSAATYTTTPGNVTIDNNLLGSSTWSKTVKLAKGTLVQFETTLILSGINRTAIANLYVNGTKKVSQNSVGNINVNNTTTCGTSIQYLLQ